MMYDLIGIIIFSCYISCAIYKSFKPHNRQYIRRNKTLIQDTVINENNIENNIENYVNKNIININYEKYNNIDILNDDKYTSYSNDDIMVLKEDFKCNLTEIIYGENNIEIYDYYYNGNLKTITSYKHGNYSENGIFSYKYHKYGYEYNYYESGNLNKIKVFEIDELKKNIYLKTYLFYHNQAYMII